MYNKLKKNIKQRYYYKNFEKKKIILKSITLNSKLKKNIRWKTQQKFFNFNYNNSITRIKKICIYTKRSKSIYSFLKISRIVLRNYASNNLLPGINKYSW